MTTELTPAVQDAARAKPVEKMTDGEQRQWEQAHLSAFGRLPHSAVMLTDTQGRIPNTP